MSGSMKRLWLPCLLVAMVMAMALPRVAGAAASAQQEFAAADRATPDLVKGEQLFGTCARCHGPRGAGSSPDNVPRIAGQHPRVVIRQLVDYRHDRRMDPQMEAVAGRHQLQPQDMADVAAFIATLEPGVATVTGRGEHEAQGLLLYRARCEGCHGKNALGSNDGLVPRLASQQYVYLLRQFHDALEGRRPLLGRSHESYWKDLDRAGLQGLADALSRMAGAGAR
jgi:cytochrome c553